MQYSVVNYKEVLECERFDAEFFKPIYTDAQSIIKKTNWNVLDSLSSKITDFGAYSQNSFVKYLDSGKIKFIRNQDILGFFIKEDENIFISEDVFKKLSLHLEKDDILVQRAGTLGKASIVLGSTLPATANQNLAQIKIDSNKINAFYVLAFLNCKYGILNFERLQTGNVQPWLNLTQIKSLKIPLFGKRLQDLVKSLIVNSYYYTTTSKSLYQQAETLLLEELGLKDWKPKKQLSYINKLSEANEAERFDAEYFQPMYLEIENKIKAYKSGYSYIKDEFDLSKDSFKVNKKSTYQYVEIGSVNVSNGAIEPEVVLGELLPANAKRKLKKGQVIISKVRTYRGAVTIVDSDSYVGSSAFTILEEKPNSKINKETLAVLLKSKPFLDWSLKPNTGTSYPVIVDNDVLSFPIPILDDGLQKQISENIIKSKEQNKISKALLEIAKTGVEKAIEESEEAATAWINSEVKKLGIELTEGE